MIAAVSKDVTYFLVDVDDQGFFRRDDELPIRLALVGRDVELAQLNAAAGEARAIALLVGAHSPRELAWNGAADVMLLPTKRAVEVQQINNEAFAIVAHGSGNNPGLALLPTPLKKPLAHCHVPKLLSTHTS